jgi:hypothetical protein
MRERGAIRIVPKSAITVVIENQGLPLTYGVVANISDHGACVWTNGHFEVGEQVALRLSFARELQPVEARGHVVWEEGPRSDDAHRYGLAWDETPVDDRGRLKTLIDRTS